MSFVLKGKFGGINLRDLTFRDVSLNQHTVLFSLTVSELSNHHCFETNEMFFYLAFTCFSPRVRRPKFPDSQVSY